MQPHNKPRVIITVEDDPLTRRLLSRYLGDAGYEVLEYENGRAAQDTILAMRNGIVVCDWHMPVMDGMALLAFVREMEREKALGTIYFVMLSANDDRDSLVHALDHGADDFLTKPYHKAELLARIRVGERMLSLQEAVWGRQTELAKANMELNVARKRLETMANSDALTGLPNRRALFDRLQDTWSISARHRRPLSAIMLDVDRFKTVNDTYGHHAGDAVLRGVAHVVRAAVRRHDLCARFGGEEFCIVCPETPLDGAAILAERVRSALQSTPIDIGTQSLNVTASIGVSTRIDTDTSPDDLISRADTMLYRGKESGRNQVWQIDGQGLASRITRMELAGCPT